MAETKRKINLPEDESVAEQPADVVVASTTISVEKELWKRFRKEAIDQDLSQRSALEEALRLWLRRKHAKEAAEKG